MNGDSGAHNTKKRHENEQRRKRHAQEHTKAIPPTDVAPLGPLRCSNVNQGGYGAWTLMGPQGFWASAQPMGIFAGRFWRTSSLALQKMIIM